MKCPICENELSKRHENVVSYSRVTFFQCINSDHIVQLEFIDNDFYKFYFKIYVNNISVTLYHNMKSIYIDGNLIGFNKDFSRSSCNMNNFYIHPDDFLFIKNKLQTYLLLK